MPINNSKSALRVVAVVVGFVALSALLAYPLSLDPGHRALELGADTRLFLWTISWDIHALLSHPLSLFDANIFFPQSRTLAYSEHLLGSALVGAPWLVGSGNPLLALNAVALLSCLGCGLGVYFLARRLGLGAAASFAAGVIFAFSPPRFFRLGQIHLATVQWIPFCLAFLHLYASGGSRKHLMGAVVFFTLQALSGGQSGLFLSLACLCLLVYLRAVGLLRPRGSVLRDFAWAGTLALFLNLPFLLPYLQVQRQAGLSRSLEESELWSPNAASFLAAPTHAQKALLSVVPGLRRKVLNRASGYLFPGVLALALAGCALARRRAPATITAPAASTVPGTVRLLDALMGLSAASALLIEASGGIWWEVAGFTLSARSGARAALVAAILLGLRLTIYRQARFELPLPFRRFGAFLRREIDSRMGLEAGFYLLLALLSFWASLGPRFGLYAALYRLWPGFDFIRVPARLTVLTLLGLAVLAGVGLDRFLNRFRPQPRRIWAGFVVVALVAEFAAFPLDARPYPMAFPPVVRWLAERPGKFALVELPVPDPREAVRSARLHSLYMLYSTAHWQKLVNGYSGHTPSGSDALFRKLVNFPDPASLEALENLGIRYAVLHRNRYSPEEWDRIEGRILGFADRLRLETDEGSGRVYSLTQSKISRLDRE